MPLVLAQVNFNVDYTLSKGVITVVVTDQGYSNSIEFYKGKYLGGSDPVEKFIASQVLGCDNLPNCEQNIYLDAIGTGIFEPGDYYFVIWDLERKNAVRKDFVLSFSDLLSCQYNNQSISKDTCVSVVTKKLEDKPLYCRNQEIVKSCAGPGFCGCPNENQICCTNENIEECKGKIGDCVLPGEKRFEKEVEIENKTVKQELENLGCVFPGSANIPDGICANNIVPGLLGDIGNSLFGYICECNEISQNEIDKDGDGYDAIALGGSDCRDEINPTGCPASPLECDISVIKAHLSCPICINPGMIESCELDLGNNNIDEDCDGRDLDCSFNCDSDGDGFLDSSSVICKTVAKLTNKQVEVNDNNAKVSPTINEICDGIDNNQNELVDEDLESCASKNLKVNEIVKIAEIKSQPEICGDNIDNNGNGEVDESSCNCVNGQSQIIKGVCSNGERVCVNGKWDVNVEPVNSCSPLIFVDGFDGKNNAIGVSRNSRIVVSASFVCQDEECNNIEVNI